MKKIIILFLLLVSLVYPQNIYANMAAPEESDVGTSITFENNDDLSVVNEVLDITVKGDQANIIATYKMRNMTSNIISTQSMFLSPNVENANVQVSQNNIPVEFTVEHYALNYTTEIDTNDWQYVVLTDPSIADTNEKNVDAISFQLNFEPHEESLIVVSYTYQLGGYPNYPYHAKRGEIEYYLSPAAMWKDFKDLTINLYLDSEMPIIKSSNLEFTKISERYYQYKSDTLPSENLKIVIDENWIQSIISSLRNPYSYILLIPIIGILAIIFGIIVTIYLYRKSKRNK
ncbi:hypothetical protein [Anaerorhabdus sp.]|uniref:hypothetical protein n=1 Tax=Anaerorhabdus sp. TaxID=1872524 RepID=UPI002FCC68E3